MKETLYILGNGPSLKNLSSEEKDTIQSADSLTMNLYPKSFDIVGIKPTHYLLLDSMDSVIKDFEVLLDRLKGEPFKKTSFWLSQYWHQRFSEDLPHCSLIKLNSWARPENINPKFKKSVWRATTLSGNYHLIRHYVERFFTGDLITTAQVRARWGWELEEELFSFRSSLIVALNLAWILKYKTVYLVGVDLNDSSHFHEPYSSIVNDDLIRKFGEAARTKLAATLWHNNIPPVQYVFKPIKRFYKQTGRKLYVTNPESLLVKESLLKFKKIPVNQI